MAETQHDGGKCRQLVSNHGRPARHHRHVRRRDDREGGQRRRQWRFLVPPVDNVVELYSASTPRRQPLDMRLAMMGCAIGMTMGLKEELGCHGV